MASAPVLNIPTVSWLKQHELLLIVLMAVLLAGWGLQKHYDHAAVAAESRAQIAESAKAAADDAAAKQTALVVQLTQQQQVFEAQQTAIIASLAQAITARQSATVVQQKKDAILPAPDLAKRWAQLVTGAYVGVAPNGDLDLPLADARLTVAQLELVPTLQENLKDETAIAVSTQAQLDAADTLVASQAAQITALQGKIVADDKANKAAMDVVVADAKKSHWRYFKYGFITGFVAGLWGGHAGL